MVMQEVSSGLSSERGLRIAGAPQSAPLSSGEYRLWFLERLFPGTPRYHVHCGIRFLGRLEVQRLQQCILRLFENHPILRAAYPMGSSGPRRVIAPFVAQPVPFCDLSAYSEEARQAAWEQLELSQASAPFDLQHGPLYRHRLVRFSDTEHCWILTQHHAITDGWSVGLIFREIAALYASDDVSTTSPRRAGYEQFVDWERSQREDPDFERHIGYWRKRLDGIDDLNFPTDRPPPKERTGRGDVVRFQLGAQATTRVDRLAQALRATRSTVLLAAFATLVGRFARQEDFAVAVAHTGAWRRRFLRELGFFVNTVPVRLQLHEGASFADHVHALGESLREDLAHAHVPFDRIVEAVSAPRGGLNPLAQVGFVMTQARPTQRAREVELSSYLRTPDASVEGGTKFDLGLSIGEDEGTLVGAFEFDTDLFDRDTIERLAVRFQQLLGSATAQPDVPISSHALLPDAERKLLVERWNATEEALPPVSSVIELLGDAFRTYAKRVALRFGDTALSYAQLETESNRIARLLHRRGVGAGALVGVMLDRTPEMLGALLGTLKVGAAYLPLDPEYPVSRIAFMLEDSSTRCVLTTSTLVDNLPSSQFETILLDVSLADEQRGGPEPARASGTANDLAYVIYTSGSTGRPKGVEITHGALCNFLCGMRSLLTPDTQTRLLALTSLSFDIAALELFLPLLVGGEVAIATRDEARDPRALCAAMDRYQTTMVQATPATWRMLVESGLVTAPTMTLLSGGEPLSVELARRLTASGASLWNLYGPTETTVWSTAWRVPPDVKRIRVGKPIANTQLYVVDSQGAPTPIGVPGEVLLGGAGVARGYRGRDDLTAERFVPNSFAPDRSARLYRTGDLGRWLPDGTLELLGRIDDQIKLRGHRLELGEIERSLEEHPGISGAACAVHTSSTGDKQLIAFVVARTQAIAEDQTDDWRRLWDETYQNAPADSAAGFNLAGWKSSVTRHPFSEDEMHAWVDETVEKLENLTPRRLIEIGCGSGLLLHRLAPRLERYDGVDYSEVAIAGLKDAVRNANLTNTEVRCLPAHELEAFEAGSYDTVVLNSVAQYFPSLTYFGGVIQKALALLRPGGALFLGDLRDYTLLQAFHTRVALHNAQPGWLVGSLKSRAKRAVQGERELCVAPLYFHRIVSALESVVSVELSLKRSRFSNEMTDFRYDVIVRKGDSPARNERPRRLDWAADVGSLHVLHDVLGTTSEERLVVCDVPNARVARDVTTAALVERWPENAPGSDLLNALAFENPRAIDPHEVWEVAARSGVRVEISPAASGLPGRFDVHCGVGASAYGASDSRTMPPTASPPQFGNTPRSADHSVNLNAALADFLRQRLPSYMIPTRIVRLDALPLTPNGKLDRRALASYPIQMLPSGGESVEAQTVWETEVTRAFQRVLRLEHVGRGDSFFELGGDSLSAVRLVADLEVTTGRTLSLSAVLRAVTVSRIAELLEEKRPGEASVDQGVNLAAEATLGDDVRVSTDAVHSPARSRVLLTGATGFLGAFLLRELLDRTNCEVVCLVRAQSNAEAGQRIRESLSRYGLSLAHLESRVQSLVGDLSRPRLGLSPGDFSALTRELDGIYHCGATVHLAHGYEALRNANVGGTREIIRLACAGAPKHLHYVSTLGVYSTRYEGMAVTEDDDAKDWQGLVGGYAKTKWVAERIVLESVKRGLKATVYRPGFVTGHSRTGVWNHDDFVGTALCETVRMGAAPLLDEELDMTPVDYVSAGVVRLAMNAQGRGEVFHLVNPSPIPLSELASWTRRRGYPVTSLSFDEWRSKLASCPDEVQARLLLAVVENLRPRRADGKGWTGGPRRFLCPSTQRALEGTGVLCPPVDDALLRCYFDYFESQGWIRRSEQERSR